MTGRRPRLPWRAAAALPTIGAALAMTRWDMLQHADTDRALLPQLLREAAPWTTMAELARSADETVALLRRRRRAEAAGLRGLAVALDERLRTDEGEYLDDPALPAERRQAIVQALHRFNLGVFAYRRFFRVLRPLLKSVADARPGPVRVLELASGSGEFSFALAKLAAQAGIELEVTGSDYFREHVEAGNARARARNLPVQFRELNAFDLSGLPAGSVDLVFIAQSIHHFSPGQVAMMVAQATRLARVGFVGIDGRRSPELYALMPVAGRLLRSPDFTHDALVTLRRFYTETELELIARLAVPGGYVSVRPELPGYSVLTACA